MTVCCNCHRRGVDTTNLLWQDLQHKTRKIYYAIKKRENQEQFSLCCLCREYLIYTGPNAKCRMYWPAMLWKFLIHQPSHPLILGLTARQKWALIPKEWRRWWVREIRKMDPSLSLVFPEPRFYLGTLDLECLEMAIHDLEWKSLSKAMDDFLHGPTVRCPFGCSEFLHLCNKLPLEDFLVHTSNGCFHGYSKNVKANRSWVNGIKPNFPSSSGYLEAEIDFVCQPTIVLDATLGPCILGCSHHNASFHNRYIHPPESITGTLYTEASNQYAQAVIQSRTIRKTKLHSFSDTYQTALLQGGYSGVDSCYLTSAGRYSPTNNLADRRDCLSIRGRDDFHYHVSQLSNNPNAKNYVPKPNVRDKLQRAKQMYPNVREVAKLQLAASTYVTLEDSISMQKQIYTQATQYLTVTRENNQGTDLVLFEPPWPQKILQIHPFDDYGERFMAVLDKHLESFVAWTRLAFVMCIPEIWSKVVASIKNNIDWNGWLISIAWNQLCSKVQHQKHQKNHFPLSKKTPKQLRQLLGISENTKDKCLYRLHWIWQTFDGIVILRGKWNDQHPSLQQAIIGIVVRNPCQSLRFDPSINIQGWELRLLVVKHVEENGTWEGCLYTRHGGEVGPKWWIQPGKNKKFSKCRGLPKRLELNFQLAVYVRKETKDSLNLRNRYLTCLGGQGKVYCAKHKMPLIINPKRHSRHPPATSQGNNNHNIGLGHNDHCSCNNHYLNKNVKTWESIHDPCTEEISIRCPHIGCGIGICNKALCTFISESSTSERIYLISETQCFIGNRQDVINKDLEETEEEATFGCDDSSTSDSTPTQMGKDEEDILQDDLGPCDGHEYPGQLLMSDQDDSDDDDDSDDYKIQKFLRSSAAADVLDVDFSAPQEVVSSPMHVIFNQQGHLLTRRKSKLRMNARNSNFWQRIVASNQGQTLPMVNPEALIFPDIFPYSTPGGSNIGAIPAALWNDEKTLANLGVASMRQHSQARMTDPATLCSTDPRYHFMLFDCLVNLGMRGNDSRLILHRGFASKQDGDGVAFNKSDNSELYGDSVENHSNVHKLAALIAERPPHFFFTQSCNQSTCKGLGKLRRWITSEEAVQKIVAKYDLNYEEAVKILRTTAAPYVQRVWDVISDLWMKYIVFSKEQPLHKIEWAWWRREFQDQAGNPSHIHAILRTAIDVTNEKGLHEVLSKIRGSLADLIHYNELQQMKQDGMIESLDCLGEIYSKAISFLTPHKCNPRCQVPKVDKDGEVRFVCKVPTNYMLTTQPQIHTIQPVEIHHSPTALAILLRLGLARDVNDSNNRATIEIHHPLLRMERHVPKCSSTDGKFSPTNGGLFVKMPSAQNLQYCTGHNVAMYLSSYVASVDQVATVFVRPPVKGSDDTLRLEHHSLNNTKINSVRHFQTQQLKHDIKTRDLPRGRPITHMEAIAVVLGSELVTSTEEFIRYPTCPKEYRTAALTPYLKTSCKPQDLQAVLAVTGQTVRIQKHFPSSRCFSNNQMKVINK